MEESHYSRRRNSRQYLPPELSIAEMYRLWKDNRGDNIKLSSLQKFTHVFNSYFKLAFRRPKTDICSACEEYEIAIAAEQGEEKKKLERAYELHKRRAKRFTQLLSEARNDKRTLAVTFDLMQNQPLPRVAVTEAYYKRQLWLYTLGIVIDRKNSKQKDAKLYTWMEHESGKGSNEICSALNHFLQTIKKRAVAGRYKRLALFCDSCPGQNKNNTLLIFLLRYVNSRLNIFEEVTVTYPVRGHSYMTPDRVFGRIEKQIKKHQVLATPQSYHEIFSKHGVVKLYGTHWQTYDHHSLSKQMLRSVTNVPMRETKIWKFQRNQRVFWASLTYCGNFQRYEVLKKNIRLLETFKPKLLPRITHVSSLKKNDVEELLKFVKLEESDRCFYNAALATVCNKGDKQRFAQCTKV